MSNYIIDAYAWVEYFNGSKSGEAVKEIIENPKNFIFTNIITVSELASSYKKKSLSFEEEKKSLLTLSKIYYIDFEFAIETGELHANTKKDRKHISLADIFVLLTAKKLNAKVVTGDEDFRGLKEALMIK